MTRLLEDIRTIPAKGPAGKKLSVHRAEAVPGVATTRVGLGLGLAAYGQECGAHTPAEALGAALVASLGEELLSGLA